MLRIIKFKYTDKARENINDAHTLAIVHTVNDFTIVIIAEFLKSLSDFS